MKKVVSIVAALCMTIIILSNTTTFATEVESVAFSEAEPTSETETTSEVEPTSEDVAPFDFSKPIKVGYYSLFTDFVEDIDSLNNRGYGVEIFEKIEELSDLEFEYVPIEGDTVAALHSGEVDLLAFNAKSAEHAEEMLYSQRSFRTIYIALFTDDADMVYGDLENIDGKTVATYHGNIGNERLNTAGENYGFSVEYVYGEMDDYTELEADFYLGLSEQMNIEELNNVLNVGVCELYLSAAFENQELLDLIDQLFYNIASTEGSFFIELEEKYLADDIELMHRGLTPREIEVLRQRPLEVGYIEDYAPISFTNENGEPDGAMVDTLNYFAEHYSFEVNYHPYNLDSPPQEHEDFDILATLFGDGEHEWEHYAITEDYYKIPLYAHIRIDSYEQSESIWEMLESPTKIGSLRYQVTDFEPFLDTYPLVEFVYYDDIHDLLDAFIAEEIDILFVNESSEAYATLYLEDLETISVSADTEIPMLFFVNHDIAEEYLPIFNVMLDRLSSSEYAVLFQNNANAFLPEQETDLIEIITDNWHYFVIAFFVIVAGFIALYYREQAKKKEALIESYNTDKLTGLMSIQKFRETIDEKIKEVKPNEYEIVSFDIDMFKTINTHFSTDRGTAIIIAVADALKATFENTGAIISRRTADQFLIFRRIDDGGSICEICRADILPAVENNINEKYKVTLSFGNVVIGDVKAKSVALIGQADSARMAGKSTHQTTFIMFDEDMRKQYEDKINITFRMEQALKDHEFVVEYQPKIDFNILQIGGAEALVRWCSRLGEKVYPNDFIPVFEENGFISSLDLYVFEEVCKYIKSNSQKINIPPISVNISAHTALSDDVVDRVSQLLSLYDINPNLIELELTESAVEANTDKFLASVKSLKALGLAISIDDFGAGVSSLNRLSAVEADVLKLDKAFFDESEKMGKSKIVVTDIIRMAKRLSMKVVAEGVETDTQAKWLKDIGCDYAQGYYFAKPMSADDFKALLMEEKQYEI